MAVDFADEIYKATGSFPSTERFGLTAQLRDASVSISSNIAEGAGRHHEKDFIRFLRTALNSVYECVSELFISRNQGYIKSQDFEMFYKKSISISKMINALISSLKNKSNNQQLTTSN